MHVHDENSVTVGNICFSCGRYQVKQCPYNNHLKQSSLQFEGDIANKCSYYVSLDEDVIIECDNKKMKKSSNKMTEKELNIALYRRVLAMEDKDRKKLWNYWSQIYPDDYANKMSDDKNESKQKKKKESPKSKNKFQDDFKVKNKSKREK